MTTKVKSNTSPNHRLDRGNHSHLMVVTPCPICNKFFESPMSTAQYIVWARYGWDATFDTLTAEQKSLLDDGVCADCETESRR
jgi:hypothetical protein